MNPALRYFVFRFLRRAHIKRHALLDRIWTLEIDADSVAMGNQTERTECRWGAFREFVETKDLFIFFTERKMAIILPKRIFDAASTDKLRRLAQTQITPLISGFPVIPLAERAPTTDETTKM
jgi:hypothetical protein